MSSTTITTIPTTLNNPKRMLMESVRDSHKENGIFRSEKQKAKLNLISGISGDKKNLKKYRIPDLIH